MAKRGRPILDDPRTHNHKVRLNEEEYARLEKICKLVGMSKSDVFRTALELYGASQTKRKE